MKKILIAFSLVLISVYASADIRRLCKVKYETQDGWSKEYTVEVQFLTGSELIKKTDSYKYSSFKNYCLIWFDKDEVAILEITTFLLSVGDEFDHEDFLAAFDLKYSIDCKQANDEKGRKWEVKARELLNFIDPRENNN